MAECVDFCFFLDGFSGVLYSFLGFSMVFLWVSFFPRVFFGCSRVFGGTEAFLGSFYALLGLPCG